MSKCAESFLDSISVGPNYKPILTTVYLAQAAGNYSFFIEQNDLLHVWDTLWGMYFLSTCKLWRQGSTECIQSELDLCEKRKRLTINMKKREGNFLGSLQDILKALRPLETVAEFFE